MVSFTSRDEARGRFDVGRRRREPAVRRRAPLLPGRQDEGGISLTATAGDSRVMRAPPRHYWLVPVDSEPQR